MIRSLQRFFSYKHVGVTYGQTARQRMGQGMDLVARTVSKTLGPLGSNVAMEYELGTPRLTKDGVTVVKTIEFEDTLMNLGASLLKQAAHQTNNFAGDGTTTSSILTNELVQGSISAIKHGYHPLKLKKGIQEAGQLAVKWLSENAQYITSYDEVLNIARVASNYSQPIAEMVTNAIIDAEGTVVIEEGHLDENILEIHEGYKLNRGMLTDSYITPPNQDVRFEDPLVLVLHMKIDRLAPFLPILDALKAAKKQFVLVAEDITGEVESALLFNFKKSNIDCVPIAVPLMDPDAIIGDLAAFTGMKKEIRNTSDLAELTLDDLGTVKRVIVGRDLSQFIGAAPQASDRISHLQYQKEEEADKEYKQLIQDRIDRLRGKLGIIQIGARGGETAKQETHDRVVDALNSIKSALNEGTLPGSGSSLYRASLSIPHHDDIEVERGYKLVRKALQFPLTQLVTKAGKSEDYIIPEILQTGNTVFNSISRQVEDCYTSGVLDSLKVTKLAILHACSVAGMVISTDCIVHRDRKYNPEKLVNYGKKEYF